MTTQNTTKYYQASHNSQEHITFEIANAKIYIKLIAFLIIEAMKELGLKQMLLFQNTLFLIC